MYGPSSGAPALRIALAYPSPLSIFSVAPGSNQVHMEERARPLSARINWKISPKSDGLIIHDRELSLF